MALHTSSQSDKNWPPCSPVLHCLIVIGYTWTLLSLPEQSRETREDQVLTAVKSPVCILQSSWPLQLAGAGHCTGRAWLRRPQRIGFLSKGLDSTHRAPKRGATYPQDKERAQSSVNRAKQDLPTEVKAQMAQRHFIPAPEGPSAPQPTPSGHVLTTGRGM